MPNLRMVYDNAVQRATITASSEAGTLLASNLKTQRKSSVWRSVGITATLTATWASPELISMASLPFCNLSSAATIRVRGYTEVADTTPVFDTGTLLAVPPINFDQFDWGSEPLGVNAFSYAGAGLHGVNGFPYGGGSYATVWTTLTVVKKVVVDIDDPFSEDGYLEAAIFVAGKHWSSKYNPDYGLQLLVQDSSKHERNDAGDLMTTRGTRNGKLTMNMGNMPPADRNQMLNIVKGNGMPKPIFVSVFPDADDTIQDQHYQMLCKLSTTSPLNHPSYNTYATSIDLEEV